MVYLPFVFFSALEVIVLMLLGFVFFNIQFKGFYFHFIITGLLLGHISYAMRGEGWGDFAPIVQLVLLILCIWGLFRIQIIYSAIITTSAYLYGFIVQTIVFFGGQALGLFNPENVSLILAGYLIPVSSICLTLITIRIIRQFDLAVDWIPNNYREKVKWNRTNRTYAFILVLSLVMYGVIFHVLSIGRISMYVILFFIIAGLFYILVDLARRRDRQI